MDNSRFTNRYAYSRMRARFRIALEMTLSRPQSEYQCYRWIKPRYVTLQFGFWMTFFIYCFIFCHFDPDGSGEKSNHLLCYIACPWSTKHSLQILDNFQNDDGMVWDVFFKPPNLKPFNSCKKNVLNLRGASLPA